MKNRIKFELSATEKFNSFEYQVNFTQEEKEGVALYRAELIKLLTSEAMPLNIPPRPPVFDRYK